MNENKNRPMLLKAIGANPVLVLLLGACPAMALTTDVRLAAAAGAAALVVMVLTAIVLAALRGLIPQCAYIPTGILVSAAFISAVELLMKAYLPQVSNMLGIYLAVCAVNLLFFGAAENSARAGFGKGVGNAFVTGLYFLVIMVVVALIRELFGAGSIAGAEIAFFKAHTINALAQSSGGFMILAFVAALVKKIVPCCDCEAKGSAFAAAGVSEHECCCKKEEE